ncbi:hypothetical protein GCM10022276_22750 [Sphingomonas limnosediminicola]|uniref:Uncharacterized protein n=2 Tax=Sphingomonas limnosediminicola TaxID=940133 RepID=A0ABP7LP89_9SPHN
MQLLAAIVSVDLGVVAALAMGPLKSTYLAWDRGKTGMPRVLNETGIATSDLPALVGALSRGTAPVRWAALMFNTPDRPSDDDTLALQVSSESGKVGFDWVLLAPRNIEDQEKFKAFARSQGLVAATKSENGVSYLRVECPDAAKFAKSVATEMYHLPASEPLALIHQGFDWPQR